ncbi:BCCT family transporter [Helicobacter anatolicus]|uniref:BCCT family transporter n=1 Tax=Helicobacter anatolicus TaxID=2905874 RepID=UPI001E4B8857|nr:BCCT family transporter [Helicobacter anatolicus]MCE3038484.1 BCCT family transporter [Helicobacter anatolicus]
MKIPSSFLPAVFFPSILLIVILALAGISYPEATNLFLQKIKDFTFARFSWFYVLGVSFFVGFMVLLALSKFGDIKLGSQNERPAFSFVSWLSMLFATGMGVGLMYFGVSEPLIHKFKLEADKQEAILHSLFHWGVHPWSIYGVTALAMAYFGFRYNAPLSLRSAFYPFLKEKIFGFWGHLIDVLALIVTIFGISTTLGFSASQLNAGLIKIGWLNESGFVQQEIIIICVVVLSTISAISGLKKGLKFLSELNLLLALCLMLFVLFNGDTNHLLASFTANIGNYLSNLVSLSFNTYVYQEGYLDWFKSWTIFYWAWWISWAPFVGFFIAKISRGRTIREFIFGVLLVPTTFNILWFSVFGNSALDLDIPLSTGVQPEKLIFVFLDHFPFSTLSTIIALIVLVLFFITSADSGIFVLNSLASCGKQKEYKWQSILWGGVLILLASGLLYSGGLDAILNAMMIAALPFALFLVLACFSLLRGLIVDERYFSQGFTESSIYWSGMHWKKRLQQILKQPQIGDMKNFIEKVIRPAMEEIKDSFVQQGLVAYIQEKNDKKITIALIVEKALARDFLYGVEVVKRRVSDVLLEDEKLPNLSKKYVFEPITFFGDSRMGYDIQYMTKEEVIVDILKQYELYLSLIDEKNEILIKEYNE